MDINQIAETFNKYAELVMYHGGESSEVVGFLPTMQEAFQVVAIATKIEEKPKEYVVYQLKDGKIKLVHVGYGLLKAEILD